MMKSDLVGQLNLRQVMNSKC